MDMGLKVDYTEVVVWLIVYIHLSKPSQREKKNPEAHT